MASVNSKNLKFEKNKFSQIVKYTSVGNVEETYFNA